MKSNLCVLSVLCIATYSSLIDSAPAQSTPESKPRVVGGYNSASIKDQEIIAAMRFAIQTRRKAQKSKMVLVMIHGAQKQVVAGMNYRLYFNIKNDGKRQNIMAVVYKDLKGKYSLSSWMAKKDAVSGPSK